MNIVVIGGGITGRLFQHLYGRGQVSVYDGGPAPRQRPRLTREFGANYLWQPLPGIACRQFVVMTHVDGRPQTNDSVMAYKIKVGKQGDQVPWGDQFQLQMTGFEIDEPLDTFVQYNQRVVSISTQTRMIRFANTSIPSVIYDTLVTTIPMPILLSFLDEGSWQVNEPWESKAIFVRVEKRPPDAPYPLDVLYVNYLSDQTVLPYRVTDRFGFRHYEGLTPMGFLPTKKITPGKIYAHKETAGLIERLRVCSIFPFGRFATWDPEELVTDTFRNMQLWTSR